MLHLRAQAVVGAVLALVGFAAVTQVQATRSDDVYGGARRQDLVLLLDSVESAAQRAEDQIADLERARDALLADTSREAAAERQAEEELQTLGILAGTLPAVGPGVRITLQDPSRAMGSATLLNALQELRDSGAEAIEINDSARVVVETALVDDPPAIVVDGVALRPPYVLDVIGDPDTLAGAVTFPGGLADEALTLGGSVSVEELSQVTIDSLHTFQAPEYASPTPG